VSVQTKVAGGGHRMTLALLAVLLAGLAYYGARGSLANFVLSWESAYDESRGSVSLIATASFLSIGLAQVVGGKLLERVAAWKVLATGLALGVGGYVLGALAPTLPIAILGVGVIAGFGGGLAANSTLSVLVAQLFRERHGALFGLVGAATAAGSVVMLPISRAVLGVSLDAALVFLAAAVGLALLGVLLFLRIDAEPKASRTAPVPVRGVIRVRDFWLLAIPFFVCGVTSTGITDTHLVAYMQGCGLTGGVASSLAAGLALFNLIGTFGSGLLTDKVDPRRLLLVIYLTRGVILLLLPLLQSTEALTVFAVVFGLADFSTVPPTTALARAAFPDGGWALVLGLIGFAHQVGSALGGAVGGAVYDATGGYGAFFVGAAATCVAAAFLSMGIGRTPTAPATRREEPGLGPVPAAT
jgi:MFS family permease